MIAALGTADFATAEVRGLHFGRPVIDGEPSGNHVAAAEIADWLDKHFALAPP
ncbi:hypothetical protein [Saccharopolyspora elongata]|uniref:hypothetical protein n=1 Tax=Saccharopolyspora elongata TaxID=2530387 RepID=UPI0014055183|nr:hypothetical protein [Saccharopolyspora elongata]